MKLNLKRIGAVATTVVACVLMFQGPASATVHTYAMDITGGDVVLSKTGTTDAVISLAPTGACPGTDPTVQYNDVTNTVQVTALSTTGAFTLGSGNFVADLVSTSSTAGTINSTTTPHTITGATITISATIYNLATGTTCGKGTRVCGFSTTLTFAGTTTSVSPSTTGTLSAPPANLTTVPPCSPPFSTYIGGQARVDNMTFHLA